MVRFLTSILAALALVAMTIAMVPGVGASAAHAATTSAEQVDGHCGGTETPSERQAPASDMLCVGACAGIPAAQLQLDDAGMVSGLAFATGPILALSGVLTEGETPPPRSAPAI